MKKLMTIVIVLLVGCKSMFTGFRAPEPAYTYWHKPNVDALETKKTMLECGFPNPNWGGRRI
jgi:hypothetical protein